LNYSVVIHNSTEKELDRFHYILYNRILKKLLSLEENPRPKGVKKLTGREEYRVKVGDYRILYRIDDKNRVVTISGIGHRREIYG
jgi:mRNA interferase RelE/StbE